MKKKLFLLYILLVGMFILTGCAEAITVDNYEHLYGFWGGLWHGFIIIISFIGSLFNDNIAIYAVNNVGGWYDFGFLIGIGGLGFLTK